MRRSVTRFRITAWLSMVILAVLLAPPAAAAPAPPAPSPPATTSADCDAPPFPDVPTTSEFCTSIGWLVSTGVTAGYLDGLFHPTEIVTRQTMAAFLHRFGRAEPDPECSGDVRLFPDVMGGVFCGSVEWLAGAGITKGNDDGTFGPVQAVTRQAFAAFLHRFAEPSQSLPVCQSAPFPDVPADNPFCPEIQWLAATGITGGYLDGTFRPTAPVTRQVMAEFLYRADRGGVATLGSAPALPTVVSLSPTAGFDAGGTVVTITGTGLGSATAVAFGSATYGPVSYGPVSDGPAGDEPAGDDLTVVSDTELTVTTPPHIVGPVTIRVTTDAGTSVPTRSAVFTYSSSVPGGVHADPTAGGALITWNPAELPRGSQGPFLGSGDFATLEEADFGFGLGGADAARLFADDGVTLLDAYSWTQHAVATYGRCPDGTGDFAQTSSPTKGAPNDCGPREPSPSSRQATLTAASPAPDLDSLSGLRINEIESNGGVPGDWVELVNIGSAPVNLAGVILRDDDDSHTYVIPSDEGPAAIGYEVAYRPAGSGSWTIVGTEPAESTVRIDGLLPAQPYQVRVRADFQAWTGDWSVSVTVVPLALTEPATPQFGYVGLDAGRDGFDITWDPFDDGGRPATVEVSYKASTAVTWTSVYAPAGDGALAVTGLPHFADYQVRIRASNATGTSSWSAEVSLVVPEPTTLPMLTIVTDDHAPIVDKDNYVAGSYVLDPTGEPGGLGVSGTLKLRGRGNSTWLQPKKPYRLKLTSSQPLLGMPASKDWVLLADSLDPTFLRNRIGMELGRQTSLAWTPQTKPLEVVLNGRYVGLYELSQHPEIDPTKIDIDELGDADIAAPELTGGYYLERDGRVDVNVEPGFVTTTGQSFAVKDPDPIRPEQFDYISGYVDDFETALFGTDFAQPETGYAAFIDVGSFVDWYLVEELGREVDAWFSSTKMYKPRSGPLYMGPLWDLDRTGGNPISPVGVPTDGWFVREVSPWYARLFEDPAFAQAVTIRWQQLQGSFASTLQEIGPWAVEISGAAANDNLVWGTTAGFATDIASLQQWYLDRMDWMATAIG